MSIKYYKAILTNNLKIAINNDNLQKKNFELNNKI